MNYGSAANTPMEVFVNISTKFFDSFSHFFNLGDRSNFILGLSKRMAECIGSYCIDQNVIKKGFLKTNTGELLPLFGLHESVFYHKQGASPPGLYISGNDSPFGISLAVLPIITLALSGNSISSVSNSESVPGGIRIKQGIEKAIYCYVAAEMNCSQDDVFRGRISLSNSIFLEISRIIKFIINKEGLFEFSVYTGNITDLCTSLSSSFKDERSFIEFLQKLDELYRKCTSYDRMICILPEDESRKTVLIYLNKLFEEIQLLNLEINDMLLCSCFNKKMESASKYRDLILIKVQLDFAKSQFAFGTRFNELLRDFTEQYLLLQLVQ